MTNDIYLRENTALKAKLREFIEIAVEHDKKQKDTVKQAEIIKQLTDENTALRELLTTSLPTLLGRDSALIEKNKGKTERAGVPKKKHRRNNTQVSLENLETNADKVRSSEESSQSDIFSSKIIELKKKHDTEKEQNAIKRVAADKTQENKRTLFYSTPPNKDKKKIVFNS